MKQRDAHIDTIRGIACVLLVAWHVIGESSASGLHVAPQSYLRYFADIFIYFRMPMFAFISGYVYGNRPFEGDARRFVVGKARRLLLPMFVVGNFFVLAQGLVLNTNLSIVDKHWTTLHILPVAHYWFLGSLFIIFITVMVLESLKLLDEWWKFTIVLSVAVAIYLTMDPHYFVNAAYFDLARTVYLFPYFLCGLASSRFCIERPHIVTIAFVVLIGAWAYAAAGVIGWLPISGRTSVIALSIGVTGSFVLMRLRWNNSGLAFIGMSSYAIYLFHVFFTASTRMIMHGLHIDNIGVLFVVGTLAGVVFPILIVVAWFGKYRIGATIRAKLVGSRSAEASPAVEPLSKIPRSPFL